MPRCNVAVMGARGKLGTHTLNALVSGQFASSFNTITAIGRDELASDQLKSLQDKAKASEATVKSAQVSYEDSNSIQQALKGVDFLINVNNFPASEKEASHHKKQNILKAAKDSGVTVYIPSEFGVDWRTNDFEQIDWVGKRQHQKEARALLPKVTAVYSGLFTESSFGPWYGLDFPNYKLTPVGTPDTLISLTFMSDVGLALASLASIFAAKGHHPLPDHIRLAGDTITYKDIKEIFETADPAKKELVLETIPVGTFEAELKSDPAELSKNPAQWIRLIQGKGHLNHSILPPVDTFKGLQGEGLHESTELSNYVNDGAWEWKKVQPYAEEVKGRPWC